METGRGRAIHAARLRKRWSQERLARDLCDRSTISRIERGEYEPLPDLWEQLAERLDLPLEYREDTTTSGGSRSARTAIKNIRLALMANQYDDASQTALTALWTLLESGHVESAVELGLEVLTWANITQWGQGPEWITVLSALLFHQVSRQSYHDVFRLGIVLQQFNGYAEHYSEIVRMNRILLTFNPSRRVRADLIMGMGTAYLRSHQLTDALVTFQQALDGKDVEQNDLSYARALHGLSAAHLKLGHHAVAGCTAQSAADHYRSLSPEFYWLAHQNWGHALLYEQTTRTQGVDALQDCAEYWLPLHRYSEYLSVQEDIYRGCRNQDSHRAQEALDAALHIADLSQHVLPKGFAG